nr:MAG TPA: hypothetical protein [Caudoviricetes sp.]
MRGMERKILRDQQKHYLYYKVVRGGEDLCISPLFNKYHYE